MTCMPSVLFVVGSSRSGTTLMGRILGRNPKVFTFHELHFFEEIWDPDSPRQVVTREAAIRLIGLLIRIQRDGYLAHRKPDRYKDEASTVISGEAAEPLRAEDIFARFLAYEARRHGADIPCDQTPRNIFFLRRLLDFYPEARIIEMIRDPRDVLHSQKNRWRRWYLSGDGHTILSALRSWSNYHPLITPLMWRAAVRAGRECAADDRMLSISFESLLECPEATVQSMCQKLGLQYVSDMLQVPRVGSSAISDSEKTGVSRKIAGQWRGGGLSTTELWLCQKLAGTEMVDLGFELRQARVNPITLVLYVLILPLKLVIAFATNIGRISSVVDSIRRRFRLVVRRA